MVAMTTGWSVADIEAKPLVFVLESLRRTIPLLAGCLLFDAGADG